MTNYDNWLQSQVSEPCIPSVIGTHIEPQDYGYTTEPIYSCEHCDERDCAYWIEYNKGECCSICGELTGLTCVECDIPLCVGCKDKHSCADEVIEVEYDPMSKDEDLDRAERMAEMYSEIY